MTDAGTPVSIAASTVQRPSAGIRDASGEVVETGRASEGVCCQVDEPRSDDRSPPPDLGHLGDVDLVLVGLGVAQWGCLGIDLGRDRSCRRRRA